MINKILKKQLKYKCLSFFFDYKEEKANTKQNVL